MVFLGLLLLEQSWTELKLVLRDMVDIWQLQTGPKVHCFQTFSGAISPRSIQAWHVFAYVEEMKRNEEFRLVIFMRGILVYTTEKAGVEVLTLMIVVVIRHYGKVDKKAEKGYSWL